MSDPRNVAHAKKVKQEKGHQAPGTSSGPKAKKQRKTDAPKTPESEPAEPAKVEQGPGDLEKSVAVLYPRFDLEIKKHA